LILILITDLDVLISQKSVDVLLLTPAFHALQANPRGRGHAIEAQHDLGGNANRASPGWSTLW